MEEDQLSEKAKEQIAGLEATNERLLAAGSDLEARTKELEAMAQRKETLMHRYR